LKFSIPLGISLLSLPVFFHKKTEKRFNKIFKYLPHIVNIMIFGVSLAHLVIMFVTQTQGLKISEKFFGSCDINPSLLSSKTGYLQE
jgi:uncharacterized membrane protein SirB2